MKDVTDLTGFPEMMDGRVKTLHPAVHGGLLGVRANPEHQAAMLAHGIAPIDLLVVNLYLFEETAAAGRGYAERIETIDIGGPAMIRAAAKNHRDVAVVVEAGDYAAVVADLDEHEGSVTFALRRRLGQKAFEAHGGLRCRHLQLARGRDRRAGAVLPGDRRPSPR